ncbi:hypothetical protein [Gynuella sunshinyii]|uniref:Uncharacterized protein n=1 Tax=Gynuella sunshinyii YC6258 TaxID=1445510 RepID=A0A0C5VPH6_9GAMM|nr:hypothetical protein [Gynuella sunshinyii]AJQ95263.1 hypothetical Protein YC6258_03227 [Gynuella sunshinyii YC6258]
MGRNQKIILLTTHEYSSPDKPLLVKLMQEGFALLLIAGADARSWENMVDAMIMQQPSSHDPAHKPCVMSFSQSSVTQLLDMAINCPDNNNHEIRMIRT